MTRSGHGACWSGISRSASHGDVGEPTLLAFEDLQWADELSLEVVGELARAGRDRPPAPRRGLSCGRAAGGSYHREWRARLLSQRLAEEARLSPLTYAETALVTTLILGTGLPAPREVVNAVYERTDGIPLHIEELLGRWGKPPAGTAARSATPWCPTRSRTRSSPGRAPVGRGPEVARAGAVIGRCFMPEVLAGMLDRPLADLDGPLEELVARPFLYPFDYLDRGFYDFRHQLLRDALYGSIPAIACVACTRARASSGPSSWAPPRSTPRCTSSAPD